MQCYVPVAVLSPPHCVRSLMATLSTETLCAFLRNKQKEKNLKNDLLTFPKWIICTGVQISGFQPLVSKGVGAV